MVHRQATPLARGELAQVAAASLQLVQLVVLLQRDAVLLE